MTSAKGFLCNNRRWKWNRKFDKKILQLHSLITGDRSWSFWREVSTNRVVEYTDGCGAQYRLIRACYLLFSFTWDCRFFPNKNMQNSESLWKIKTLANRAWKTNEKSSVVSAMRCRGRPGGGSDTNSQSASTEGCPTCQAIRLQWDALTSRLTAHVSHPLQQINQTETLHF